MQKCIWSCYLIINVQHQFCRHYFTLCNVLNYLLWDFRYPNSQLANQKPTLLSWYPTISWSGTWAEFGYLTVNTNRTFWVRFGAISGSFSLAIGILPPLRLAKIRTVAPPNSPDMPPKRTKKVRLGIRTILFRTFRGSLCYFQGKTR